MIDLKLEPTAKRIKEYFKTQRVSNSYLGLLNSPQILKERGDKCDISDDETKFFRIGSALDIMLTSPDLFGDEFVVLDVVRPTGMMVKFIEALPEGIFEATEELQFLEAYELSGYKIKLRTVIQGFFTKKDTLEYYSAIQDIDRTKSIISKDEIEIIANMCNLIKSNVFTRKYFFDATLKKQLIHQLPIYFEVEGVECKALLDGVLINHEQKIIQPFDLKSIGKPIGGFSLSFYQFGYYRQAAFYYEATRQWAKRYPELADYKILPFQFIVVESRPKSKESPIIYTCTHQDLFAGTQGGCLKQWDSKCVKGFIELIDDWKWHIENDYWLMSRELFEAEGQKQIDIFI